MASNKIKIEIEKLPEGLLLEPCSFQIDSDSSGSYVTLRAAGPPEKLLKLIREPFAPKMFLS